MRITDNMQLSSANSTLRLHASKLNDLSRIASSGKKISRPSHGPSAYSSITARDGALRRLDSRREAISRANSDLIVAEGALASAGDLMITVEEIATKMADGSWSADERRAAASEVAQLREQLIGIANTKGSRGYLFGGTATADPPFTSAGVFVGNDGVMNLEIAEGQLSAANISGQSTFTDLSGGRNIFQDLSDLEAALLIDDQATVASMLDEIEAGRSQIVNSRAEAGVRIDRLTSAIDVTEEAITVAADAQSVESEADPTEIYSQLIQAQSAYETSLTVTRQLLSMISSFERF